MVQSGHLQVSTASLSIRPGSRARGHDTGGAWNAVGPGLQTEGRDDRRLGALAVVLGMLLVLLTTVVALDGSGLSGAEHTVGQRMLAPSQSSAAFRSFWLADASVQGPTVCRVLILTSVGALLVVRRWWHAAWLATVLVLSAGLAGSAKLLLARPRPTWPDPVASAAGYAYPSGHATAGWTLAVVVVLLSTSCLPRGTLRTGLVVLAVSSAVIVSLDRLFLGVHYPTDVVAGALLGSLTAIVPWLVLRRRLVTSA